MIINSDKKCTISIIDKQNITISRQKWLVAHPYTTRFVKRANKHTAMVPTAYGSLWFHDSLTHLKTSTDEIQTFWYVN